MNEKCDARWSSAPIQLDRSPEARDDALRSIQGRQNRLLMLRLLARVKPEHIIDEFPAPEHVEVEEARLLNLERRLFCIDHPEFAVEQDGETLVLSDVGEIHFRLERC